MLDTLLRHIARRCETHDRFAYTTTVRLERELGLPESPAPASFRDAYTDPGLIDCRNSWCRSRG